MSPLLPFSLSHFLDYWQDRRIRLSYSTVPLLRMDLPVYSIEDPDFLSQCHFWKDQGLDVRVHLPHTLGSLDYQPNRLNLAINAHGRVVDQFWG